MTELRVLTVRQPWASLIALGHKRIEVRSRPTKYRGWVAIHAGARSIPVAPVNDSEWGRMDFRVAEFGFWRPNQMIDLATGHEQWLPFGKIIAVARLTDSLPIVPREWPMRAIPSVSVHGPDDPSYPRLLHWKDGEKYADNVTDQLPYAPAHMWEPGHHAWLLDDERPLDQPIAHKGGLGLRLATPEIADLLAGHLETVVTS